MSNTKTVMSQAANTLVKPLEVEDVFSTYLYDGNGGSSLEVNNGIDLDGEGGLVWLINRENTFVGHTLYDTERGAGKNIRSHSTNAEATNPSGEGLLSFNSDGFSLGSNYQGENINEQGVVSWTFRKAPKFFDVVTYTGTGSAQDISHNLSSVPGMIVVKRTDSTSDWGVYHRQLNDGTDRGHWRIKLNSTGAEANQDTFWNDTAPTDSVFTVGTSTGVNASGGTYVAYLFAHNDGDGGFNGGDIIKCGSYTGNGSTDGPEIDLGFEPQWCIIKRTDDVSDWRIFDSMRGWVVGSDDAILKANTSGDEAGATFTASHPTSTGLKINSASGSVNGNGGEYIYIAIRRGTKVPESGTEVFNVAHRGTTEATNNNVKFYAGFPIDTAWQTDNKTSAFGLYFTTRLTGGNTYLYPYSTAAESGVQANDDMQNNWGKNTGTGTENTNAIAWMWKRAPNFFDVVAYTGDGVAGRTVPSNLEVPSEMIWGKRRDSTGGWLVYHKDLSAGQYLFLNADQAPASYPFFGTQTADGLVLNNAAAGTLNGSGEDYIAYLFASLDGVSKVGSYTGTGSAQTIDCGFTSGARFILVKRTDSTGDWYVWDTERGIVAGNDPYLELNTTDAEVTSTDWVDPDNSGFIVNGTTINASSAEYIFYAIA